MPITVTYDLQVDDGNVRSYIRSMLERFHWRRLGGSVLRYDGVEQDDGSRLEDWLNHVIPALMFMRSYTLKHNAKFKFFTLDAQSVAYVDHSDAEILFGRQPESGQELDFETPTNDQSSKKTIMKFIDAATNAT